MTVTNARGKQATRAVRRAAPRRSLARFVRLIQAQLTELSQEYHVKSLGVFGSFVRHQERSRSDLDVLVEFYDAISFDAKSALAQALSKLLGVKVDVVQREGLPHYIGKQVMREVIWLQKDGVRQPVKLTRRKPTRTNGRRNGAHMEPEREYLDYMQDMLDNMARVQRFVAGVTMEDMIANEEKDFAVRFALQTIGEAANRIPRDVQKLYPFIPWREIIAMRNAMAHGYDHILYARVWQAVTESIPRDAPLVARMLQDEKKRRGVNDET
jgi:uncharacterized protein with HEPN domain/predicted nucleotidyltransferase